MVETCQKRNNLQEGNNIDQLALQQEIESRQRVWQNLEKILDQFEKDFVKSQDELKESGHFSPSKNYFNWDF